MQVNTSMLKVLLVDDEPYIRKGLVALIDWEAEGYYIAGEASNGNSALQLLKQGEYDLIISDIKMPEMDGIEFITQVREKQISKAKFIFLSGFYDFQYTKTAIKCGCCDYILKPILKEDLLLVIRKIYQDYQNEAGREKNIKDYEKAYLDRHLMAIIWGKYDCVNIRYVKERMNLSGELVYIHCELTLNDERFNKLSEEERREQQRKLYQYAGLLLKNNADHILYDSTKHTECYAIGVIYCSYMANEPEPSFTNWFEWFQRELSSRMGYEIVACAGCKVQEISMLADSYREAVIIRSFRFYKKHELRNSVEIRKESELKGQKEDHYKKQLDELIHVIEINDRIKIRESARSIYRCMVDKETDSETISRNIQYLLYRLLGLAYNQDAEINQEDIMQYMREDVFSAKMNQGNASRFQKFAEEYSDFLCQLRQSTVKSTISLIETEIEDKYAENLSLKYLGEKYYINSAYLGQVFKKKYGCAFKDYLNNTRIRKSAEIMLRTDKKIYEIANDVGYKNIEYFVNKFEEVYGMTPTRFRKRSPQNQQCN